MYYEISVYKIEKFKDEYNMTKNIFCTAPRCLPTSKEVNELYKILKEKFPDEEGYRLRVLKYDERPIERTAKFEEERQKEMRRREKDDNKKKEL